MDLLPMGKEIVCRSLAETDSLAARFFDELEPGAFVALYGPLGAGKTTFVRGVAKAAGCDPDDVSSPSFTIINEYHSGKIPLFHFDLYRMADPSEFYTIGGDEYLTRNGIVLLEWPENGKDYLPDNRHEVFITIKDAETRVFTFSKVAQ